MRVYYAHSVALYGTKQEARDIADLEAVGVEVVNPNAPKHDAGYKDQGMDYFMGLVLGCTALVFRANPDGTINAGVAKEIEFARMERRPVFELPSGIDRRTLTVAQTRSYLTEQGVR